MPYSGLQLEIHQKRVPAKTYIFMEGNRCYGTTTVACLIRTGKILVGVPFPIWVVLVLRDLVALGDFPLT